MSCQLGSVAGPGLEHTNACPTQYPRHDLQHPQQLFCHSLFASLQFCPSRACYMWASTETPGIASVYAAYCNEKLRGEKTKQKESVLRDSTGSCSSFHTGRNTECSRINGVRYDEWASSGLQNWLSHRLLIVVVLCGNISEHGYGC